MFFIETRLKNGNFLSHAKGDGNNLSPKVATLEDNVWYWLQFLCMLPFIPRTAPGP